MSRAKNYELTITKTKCYREDVEGRIEMIEFPEICRDMYKKGDKLEHKN